MLINEVIDRADRLIDNEYTREEKYHWCDVVSSELLKMYRRSFKRARLHRWRDGMFLLPQDCGFDGIEKLIFMGREIPKQDMRTYGFEPVNVGGGRTYIQYRSYRNKHKDGRLETCSDTIDVVYLASYRPIRRISLEAASLTVPETKGRKSEIIMGRDCPFMNGDVVEVTCGDTKVTLNIIRRTADFDDESMTMFFRLECGEGEADALPTGESRADMRRIVTDRTVCDAPYDELYIDYICAQICFYQRKHDVYLRFIERYNARVKEYASLMRAFAVEEDNTEFANWWRL